MRIRLIQRVNKSRIESIEKEPYDAQHSIFTELADFLATQPTLEQLAEYRVSPGIQQYIDDLLERNREEGLSAEERLELEKILAVIQMMDLAKAKAQLRLARKTQAKV